ncbi:MAG: hypothetical protein K5686_08210 [Lachnospiraceae bacterium]|nr:hypothetical protein [Lachnospiraceae bacterium]
MAVKEREKDLRELEEMSQRSETAIANKMAMAAYTIICVIICLAYVLEVVKGARTVPYVLLTFLLGLAPVAAGWVIYSKRNDTPAVKHIVVGGFGLFYTFLLFTAQNELVFTYALTILVAITVFKSRRIIGIFGWSVVAENIIVSVIKIKNAADPKAILATIEIQVILMIVITIFLIMVSKVNIEFEQIRMAGIHLQERKAQMLTDRILEVTERMSGTIETVSSEMETLKESVDRTVDSMEEVSTGTSESSDAVQRQLLKTEEIQEHVSDVEKAAAVINENVKNTGDAVKEGTTHIDELNTLTREVDQVGKDVAAALEVFKQTTSKMNTITDIITDVASETSLLSLNASIEAARAGDAGRGFAVVASEISGLATQTTEATGNIVSLIENITSQLDTMVDTIQRLIRTGAEESRCAEQTAASFNTISESVQVIEKHSEDLADVVTSLASANREIVDSIQTISAITEEVTAHASETHDASVHNQSIVDGINNLVAELNEDAVELKA